LQKPQTGSHDKKMPPLFYLAGVLLLISVTANYAGAFVVPSGDPFKESSTQHGPLLLSSMLYRKKQSKSTADSDRRERKATSSEKRLNTNTEKRSISEKTKSGMQLQLEAAIRKHTHG
jgi:hypothetical protein